MENRINVIPYFAENLNFKQSNTNENELQTELRNVAQMLKIMIRNALNYIQFLVDFFHNEMRKV